MCEHVTKTLVTCRGPTRMGFFVDENVMLPFVITV